MPPGTSVTALWQEFPAWKAGRNPGDSRRKAKNRGNIPDFTAHERCASPCGSRLRTRSRPRPSAFPQISLLFNIASPPSPGYDQKGRWERTRVAEPTKRCYLKNRRIKARGFAAGLRIRLRVAKRVVRRAESHTEQSIADTGSSDARHFAPLRNPKRAASRPARMLSRSRCLRVWRWIGQGRESACP